MQIEITIIVIGTTMGKLLGRFNYLVLELPTTRLHTLLQRPKCKASKLIQPLTPNPLNIAPPLLPR